MKFETTIMINTSSNKIFALYMDVNNWSKWDPEIKESFIDGEFKEGTTGFLKPMSGPKSKFVLTKVIQNKSFTAKTTLPLCNIYFERNLISNSSSTKVVHRIIFDGFLAPLFGKLLGNKLKEEQSHTMKSLKKEVEK